MTSPDEGPEWADEAHLDEVFSAWVPGPPDSASAAEKEMAGENPPLELPAEDDISDEDMEAALAAALAEAEQWNQPDFASVEADLDPPAPPPPPAERSAASEPASPSWLNVPEPEAPPAPIEPSSMEPDPTLEAEAEAEPEPEPFFEPEREPGAQTSFDPGPPPAPQPTGPARPWARSDDDILPGRKGKGRRR